ncbi:HIT family protein [Fervidibacter sp.]|jgi:ATP adenylyltransferase
MPFKILWAPWRLAYVTKADEQKGCIFCEKPKEQRDRENLIVARFERCFVILNAFPYNNGHLMVVPYRHVPSLLDLTDDELAELMKVTQIAERVLREALKPHGFNIGMNLGRCAGAGIEDHLHIHIVPRWNGDTNFMPVIGETKVLPELLSQTYEKLVSIPLWHECYPKTEVDRK